MKRSYHVLSELIPADDVVAMLADAGSPWANKPVEARMQDVTPLLRHVRFNTAGSSTTVSLIGDDIAQTLYLAIEGEQLDEVRTIARVAESRLPVASFAALLNDANGRYRNEPHLLIRLALATTPVTDTNALVLFVRAAKDADPAVRKAAINALGLTQWLRAFDPLEDREANDPEPELRAFARQTIYSLRLALGMEQ
jgi:hypothetical protein